MDSSRDENGYPKNGYDCVPIKTYSDFAVKEKEQVDHYLTNINRVTKELWWDCESDSKHHGEEKLRKAKYELKRCYEELQSLQVKKKQERMSFIGQALQGMLNNR